MGVPPVPGLDFGDPNGLTDAQKKQNGDALRAYAAANKAVLGFAPNEEIVVPSFHPVFRITPDGSLRTDMVVEMVQTRRVPFNKSGPGLGTFPMRGGATLIIQKPCVDELNEGVNESPVRYVIARRLDGAEGAMREARQRRHNEQLGLAEGNDPDRFRVDFALAHGGL